MLVIYKMTKDHVHDSPDTSVSMPASWRTIKSGMTRAEVHSQVGLPVKQDDREESWNVETEPSTVWLLKISYGTDGRVASVVREMLDW